MTRAGLLGPLAALMLGSALSPPALAGEPLVEEAPADVCLEVAAERLSEPAWSALVEGVRAAVDAHPALFPRPVIAVQADGRVDIGAGHEVVASGTGAPCLEPGYEWTARFGRALLEAGADRLLAEAPTTPGIDSDVSLAWHPEESRLRTTLEFAGPFDIPNGRCWVDDRLSVDPATGLAVASGEEGRQTSPLAEWACDRFFSYLPDGGAGEQAVGLLPNAVELPDGRTVRLLARTVAVHDDAIVVAGDIEDS